MKSSGSLSALFHPDFIFWNANSSAAVGEIVLELMYESLLHWLLRTWENLLFTLHFDPLFAWDLRSFAAYALSTFKKLPISINMMYFEFIKQVLI